MCRSSRVRRKGRCISVHLRRGGLLTLADTLDEHVDQLARSFESADADRRRVREFITMFVRPYGLDQPATPRVVDAIEQQAAVRPQVRPIPLRVRTLQRVLQVGVNAAVAPKVAARVAQAGERARVK
jgi:hypothetical protein